MASVEPPAQPPMGSVEPATHAVGGAAHAIGGAAHGLGVGVVAMPICRMCGRCAYEGLVWHPAPRACSASGLLRADAVLLRADPAGTAASLCPACGGAGACVVGSRIGSSTWRAPRRGMQCRHAPGSEWLRRASRGTALLPARQLEVGVYLSLLASSLGFAGASPLSVSAMAPLLEKIAALELEIGRTQKNKACDVSALAAANFGR